MQIVKNVQKIGDEEVTILFEPLREIKTGYDYGDQRGKAVEELVESAQDMFGSAMALTHNCAKRTVEGIKTMLTTDICPDEFEISFAIKIDSEVGGEAQIQVTMKWTKSAEQKKP